MTTSKIFKNYVPCLRKSDFDDIATDFLKQYCPEALIEPMVVPIEEIATKKMGLTILNHRLTEDFSILGEMCFTGGLAEIYDRDKDEYQEIQVKKGTMIIDPDNLSKRNLGSLRNTIVHECLHWNLHRNYHIEANAKSNKKMIACRCAVVAKDEQPSNQWSDEDWMEWQATGIAPRILMPKITFVVAYAKAQQDYEDSPYNDLIPDPDLWVIEQLASEYKVSKQSTAIRIEELGLSSL